MPDRFQLLAKEHGSIFMEGKQYLAILTAIIHFCLKTKHDNIIAYIGKDKFKILNLLNIMITL
ncbi:MAG: hypothetical protein EU539_09465 [Promethearchaeota archaeon]|nr:MAG: hypothetical protein EU539_09465 [Candidatus Lokiarchaeota archaeon]